MAASLSLRAYKGTGAGTESGALSEVTLSGGDDFLSTPVAPGSRSFERWLRLRVDTAPAVGVANFWVQCDGALPTGVSLKFGVTDTPATPVATTSLVATKDLVAGRRFIFDAATLTEVGQHSRYLVIQEVVAADAATGVIDPGTLKFGFSEA